jgi:Tol biopolymer transport system component
VDAKGCHLTRLTHQMNGVSPSWSPTGRQIAFAVGGINVINADGTGFRQLTTDRAPSGRYRYDDVEPAWSAGNRIAFARIRMGTSRGEIYTMNANGSGVAPLTDGGPGFVQPSWSPDGKAIAFVADAVPVQSAGVIEVANADGTGRHRVSPLSWGSYSPAWTPDGRVVFLVKKGAQTSAYIVRSDGTGMRLLYPNLGDALQIAWGSAALPSASC